MFFPFELEQYLSENEEHVRYNFSESGVHPLTLAELRELADIDVPTLDGTLLNYPEVRGTEVLRARIAALYSGASADQVLVTVGASEANHLVASTLLDRGDRALSVQPSYLQLAGSAKNRGVVVDTVSLDEDNGWALNVGELAEKVTAHTKLISVVNPHNPTGHILTEDEREALVDAAQRVGAWIVADEVYIGTERGEQPRTPSLWGDYDRVVAINSMSKAYGLPGLRIGWLVAPTELIPPLWRRHEYATISASMLGNALAAQALRERAREKLTARARSLINHGFDVLTRELGAHPGLYSVVPPQASAMCIVRYDLPVDSREFVDRLVAEHDTLVVPGSCFGLPRHFRFSSALAEDYLTAGIARINQLASDILSSSAL